METCQDGQDTRAGGKFDVAEEEKTGKKVKVQKKSLNRSDDEAKGSLKERKQQMQAYQTKRGCEKECATKTLRRSETKATEREEGGNR